MRLLIPFLLFSSFAVAESSPVVVQWRYYTDHIDYQSVCYNYPKNSVDWRTCRREAVYIFRDRCGEYSRKADRTGDVGDIQMRRMYCTAAQSYNPL